MEKLEKLLKLRNELHVDEKHWLYNDPETVSIISEQLDKSFDLQLKNLSARIMLQEGKKNLNLSDLRSLRIALNLLIEGIGQEPNFESAEKLSNLQEELEKSIDKAHAFLSSMNWSLFAKNGLYSQALLAVLYIKKENDEAENAEYRIPILIDGYGAIGSPNTEIPLRDCVAVIKSKYIESLKSRIYQLLTQIDTIQRVDPESAHSILNQLHHELVTLEKELDKKEMSSLSPWKGIIVNMRKKLGIEIEKDDSEK